jgi:hypothetical protein
LTTAEIDAFRRVGAIARLDTATVAAYSLSGVFETYQISVDRMEEMYNDGWLRYLGFSDINAVMNGGRELHALLWLSYLKNKLGVPDDAKGCLGVAFCLGYQKASEYNLQGITSAEIYNAAIFALKIRQYKAALATANNI